MEKKNIVVYGAGQLFLELKNVLAAGIPARILREDILWSRDGEVLYNRESYMDCIEQIGVEYI